MKKANVLISILAIIGSLTFGIKLVDAGSFSNKNISSGGKLTVIDGYEVWPDIPKWTEINLTSGTANAKIAIELIGYSTPIGCGTSVGCASIVHTSVNYTLTYPKKFAMLPRSGMSCPSGYTCYGAGDSDMTRTKIGFSPYNRWDVKIVNKGSSTITISGSASFEF